MAYRTTPKIAARQAALRENLLNAALSLVAEGGFGALTIAATANRAGVATGTVYKYFASKGELCAEVFRLGTEKEVAQVQAAASLEGKTRVRLENAVGRFAERALQAPRLAYALIAEPADSLVDKERLNYRRAYAAIFEQLVSEGVENGEFAPQNPAISAAALVGIIAEALIGPLTWQEEQQAEDQGKLIAQLQAFCVRAVGAG